MIHTAPQVAVLSLPSLLFLPALQNQSIDGHKEEQITSEASGHQ